MMYSLILAKSQMVAVMILSARRQNIEVMSAFHPE